MEGLEDKGSGFGFRVSLSLSEFSIDKSLAAPIPPVKAYCHSLCQRCGNTAKEPVLNIVCGHLFCWCCIYKLSMKSGFEKRCPKCRSHMDISRGTTNTTIISVYSGPEPGIYYNPTCDSEPEEDEDELEKSKEEGEPEDDEDELEKPKEEKKASDDIYVPPRPPMWNGGCRYASVVITVGQLLFRFNTIVQIAVKPKLEGLCWKRVHDFQSVASGVELQLNRMIGYLQKSLQWAHGEKIGYGPINPNKAPRSTEPQQWHYDPNPQTVCFDIISDSTFCCKICHAPAYEPVVTRCGHLFCWSCIYLDFQSNLSCIRVAYPCPFCNVTFEVFNGCLGMNPIYYGGGLCPEKEDELLIGGRRLVYQDKTNIDQILCVPRRPPMTVALRFLHHMLDACLTEQTHIKNRFDKLIDKSNIKKKDRKHIAKEIEDGLNLLHNQLSEEWMKELSENEISNCTVEDRVLDFIGPKWNMSNPNNAM